MSIPDAIPRHLQTFPISTCCVAYCDVSEMETAPFDTTSITCFRCKKFTCKSCSENIWKGHWINEEFQKPKIDQMLGLVHEIWKCPCCRASFDRIK